jgi:hypothetical protein
MVTIPATSNNTIRSERSKNVKRPVHRHIHRRIRPDTTRPSHNVHLACTFSGVYFVSSESPAKLSAKLHNSMRILWELVDNASRPGRPQRRLKPCRLAWPLVQVDLPNEVILAPKSSLAAWQQVRDFGTTIEQPHSFRSPRAAHLHQLNVFEQHGPTRAIFLHPLVCDLSNDRAYGIRICTVRRHQGALQAWYVDL